MPRISGRQRVTARIRGLGGPNMGRDVGKALYAGGQMLELDVAESIVAGSVSGKGHVASLPSEPPNADTHLLDRSIETALVAPLRVEVSVNAPYARPLNYGTARMAPRPFVEPAVARKKRAIVELVRGAVRKITRGGNGG